LLLRSTEVLPAAAKMCWTHRVHTLPPPHSKIPCLSCTRGCSHNTTGSTSTPPSRRLTHSPDLTHLTHSPACGVVVSSEVEAVICWVVGFGLPPLWIPAESPESGSRSNSTGIRRIHWWK